MQQQQLVEVECQLERTVAVEEEADLSDLGSFVVVEIASTAVAAVPDIVVAAVPDTAAAGLGVVAVPETVVAVAQPHFLVCILPPPHQHCYKRH